VLASCHNSDEKKKATLSSWEKIQINTRTQKISISNDSDSAVFEQHSYKQSHLNGLGGADSDTATKINFTLTNIERNSLYTYVLDLITNPCFTEKGATDYAGYVQVNLIDRNTKLTCEYKSVGEWSTVSSATEKIYNLLKRKIPIAHQ
jgi:hypothetical protein